MATWFEITYTGEPTEADYARVAELAAQGFTSGQLISEPEADGPHTAVAESSGSGFLVTCPLGCNLGTSAHAPDPELAAQRIELHRLSTTPLDRQS